MSVAIVTTTIHVPTLLEGYCENLRHFGHTDVTFIIAGDTKTPADIIPFCRRLEETFGIHVVYMGPGEQEEFLQLWPNLKAHLPWQSLSRRNVAILKAYTQGADIIITIDDDNFVLKDQDFVSEHSRVGRESTLWVVTSSSGWFNICDMLTEAQGLPFYPRGFPLRERWKTATVTHEQRQGRVVVNGGLWLEAPDIDALTWLDLPVRTTNFSDRYPRAIALGHGTWTPFNSQNTALAKEVIPAYFLSPYVGRYDDIWASYIVKKISDHLGDYIAFGTPLVRQIRNPHNYFIDFDRERLGMELTGQFLDALAEVSLTGKNYRDCMGEVADYLEGQQSRVTQLFPQYQEPLRKFIEGMQIWRKVCVTIESPVRL